MGTVLIIESDVDLASRMQQALRARGLLVEVIADGNEALSHLRLHKPDAIVLCVELGRLSGYSICNKLKKEPTLSPIPLILTSSQATAETFEQHRKLKTHAQAYIKKPFQLSEFEEVVGRFVALVGGHRSDQAGDQQADSATADLHEQTRTVVATGRVIDAPGEPVRTPGPAVSPSSMGSEETTQGAARSLPLPSAEPVAAAPLASDLDAPHDNALTAWAEQDADMAVKEPAAPSQQEQPSSTAAAPQLQARPLVEVPDPFAPVRRNVFQVEQAALPQRQAVARPSFTTPKMVPAVVEGEVYGAAETRAEQRALRQKVAQLEQWLAQKDIDFNERLLQESSRSRDSAELTKKISLLERDMAAFEQRAVAAQEQATQAKRACEAAMAGEHEAQAALHAQTQETAKLQVQLQDISAQLSDVQQEKVRLESAYQDAHAALQVQMASHDKARKALEAASSLLEELAPLPNRML